MRFFGLFLCLIAITPFAGSTAVIAQEEKDKPCKNPEGTDCCCIPAHETPPEGCRRACTDKPIECEGLVPGHAVPGKCVTGKAEQQCAKGENMINVTVNEYNCIKQLCTLPNGQQGRECAWALFAVWEVRKVPQCTGHFCS